jgi:pimeloyl-ACP methyl ester carboxylesterase
MMRFACFFVFILLLKSTIINSQVNYPWPLHTLTLRIENQPVKKVFMDVSPDKPNGRTVILFHGKNFNGYYWKEPAAYLSGLGYRVIIPDQVGWGRSDKPDLHYSFHMLADNTRMLLDSLGIDRVTVIGHSMGGMLATRFTLMFPGRVNKLVLENPIGLEDYRTFVPYQPVDSAYVKERSATYESYRRYQQSYYPAWKPEYEQYVRAQAESLDDPQFTRIAMVNALTYLMIYEQPVVYEFSRINVPTLLIIGQEDRTVVGKDRLTPEQKKLYGQYPSLGRKTQQAIKGSKLVELPGVGHIPHIQEPARFNETVAEFLGK